MRNSVSSRLLSVIGDWIDTKARDGTVALIGICGSQGSGKTNLAAVAAESFGAATFSLDDVYLTKAQRQTMAATVHPLFAVRGVPGTHDLALAGRTIKALTNAGPQSLTPVPAFDKLADDRFAKKLWPVFEGRPRAILIEGWCLGATPIEDEALVRPINSLEAQDDPLGVWRRAWNASLRGAYQDLSSRLDATLFLRAPGFDVVLDWRSEQEAELFSMAAQDLPTHRKQALNRFVAHYQRLTMHMLEGGVRATATAQLGPQRQIVSVTAPDSQPQTPTDHP